MMVKTLAVVLSCLGLLWETSLSAAEPAPNESPAVTLLSFNIRYGTAKDGPDAWPLRREMVIQVLRDQSADFVGLQEALRFQIDHLREALPEYAELGVGRDDGKTAGEYSSILFRKDRWQLVEGKTWWLSETPDVPGSKTWGNTIPRIVTWGRFRSLDSSITLDIFNSHFDHMSQPSRVKSAEFLAGKIDALPADAAVVVMGDFNAGEDNPAITRLLSGPPDQPARLIDTFRVVHPGESIVGTFNGFQGTKDGPKIDYILTRPDVTVETAEIIRKEVNGRYPSDHFPVSAKVRFRAGP